MESAINYLKRKHGIPDGTNMELWVKRNRIPRMVKCSYCGMSVTIFEASADKEGYLFCPDCVFETDKTNHPMQLLEDAKRATMEARKHKR